MAGFAGMRLAGRGEQTPLIPPFLSLSREEEEVEEEEEEEEEGAEGSSWAPPRRSYI